MIKIKPNPKNPNNIIIEGNTNDLVADYLSELLQNNGNNATDILRYYSENHDITWGEIQNKRLEFIPNKILYKNNKDSPIQKDWYTNIYNIDFTKLNKTNFFTCLHNKTSLYDVYRLSKPQENKVEKAFCFTHDRLNPDILEPLATAKTISDIQTILSTVTYSKKIIKNTTYLSNTKYLLEFAVKSKKVKLINEVIEHLYGIYNTVISSNKLWESKFKYHYLLDKWIAQMIKPITKNIKITNVSGFHESYTQAKRYKMEDAIPYIIEKEKERLKSSYGNFNNKLKELNQYLLLKYKIKTEEELDYIIDFLDYDLIYGSTTVVNTMLHLWINNKHISKKASDNMKQKIKKLSDPCKQDTINTLNKIVGNNMKKYKNTIEIKQLIKNTI